jgi:hypothetical protein
MPPVEDPRSLTDYVDPPRRRERLKMTPRRVSTHRRTYQVMRMRQGCIGRIGHRIYVVYRQKMV